MTPARDPVVHPVSPAAARPVPIVRGFPWAPGGNGARPTHRPRDPAPRFGRRRLEPVAVGMAVVEFGPDLLGGELLEELELIARRKMRVARAGRLYPERAVDGVVGRVHADDQTRLPACLLLLLALRG